GRAFINCPDGYSQSILRSWDVLVHVHAKSHTAQFHRPRPESRITNPENPSGARASTDTDTTQLRSKREIEIAGEEMAEQTTAAAGDSDAGDMESKIKAALRLRVSYFREQADSLTLVGVRRLLEEDLGFDMYALDPHKKFCLEAANDDQPEKEENELNTTGSQTMEDSPVLGLMTDNKKAKRGTKEKEETQNHAEIKEAIRKRASHLKENSGSITGVGVRRLLEEDLKLEKFALDAFKKFISGQVTELLKFQRRHPEMERQNRRRVAMSKHLTSSTKEELSGSSENESEESEESAVKAKKRTAPKGKVQGSAGLKRKRAEVDKNDSKRKSKVSKIKSEENSDKDEDDVSDDNSESSAENNVQEKEVAKPSYGKRVEHLKTVIKSCGMSVPPSVYKKVKQAPENKREATLIKELEELLQKEGLSSSPSEKEIKEVKEKEG
ncbi:hypothetical protein AKJ16_DCAP22514, partial [Drosera capensis]